MTDKFMFHRPAYPKEISGSILGDGRQASRQSSDASTHPVVTYWLHLAIGSTCMDDRHSQLLTWLSGTVFQVPSRTQPSVPMYSDVHGKRFCSHDTRTLGTLWVGSTSMHSINWCITLYYITISQWHHTRNWLPADNQLQQTKHQFLKKIEFHNVGYYSHQSHSERPPTLQRSRRGARPRHRRPELRRKWCWRRRRLVSAQSHDSLALLPALGVERTPAQEQSTMTMIKGQPQCKAKYTGVTFVSRTINVAHLYSHKLDNFCYVYLS